MLGSGLMEADLNLANKFASDWYAAFVETGKEDNVRERLEYRFQDRLDFYVPKRRLRERKGGIYHDVVRTLFPGYVLVNGKIGMDEYYGFKNIPGLWRLLKDEENLLSIAPKEAEIINKLISDSVVIGPSTIYKEGSRVRVISGPLCGMEGYIIKVDSRKGRARVRLPFLGEERITDLAVNMLSKS